MAVDLFLLPGFINAIIQREISPSFDICGTALNLFYSCRKKNRSTYAGFFFLEDFYTILYMYSTIYSILDLRVVGPVACPRSVLLSTPQLLAHCIFTLSDRSGRSPGESALCHKFLPTAQSLLSVLLNVTTTLVNLPRRRLVELTSGKMSQSSATVTTAFNSVEEKKQLTQPSPKAKVDVPHAQPTVIVASEKKEVPLETPTGPTKDEKDEFDMVLPGSLGGSWKETIYMRLNNKVRKIEADVSVSMR